MHCSVLAPRIRERNNNQNHTCINNFSFSDTSELIFHSQQSMKAVAFILVLTVVAAAVADECDDDFIQKFEEAKAVCDSKNAERGEFQAQGLKVADIAIERIVKASMISNVHASPKSIRGKRQFPGMDDEDFDEPQHGKGGKGGKGGKDGEKGGKGGKGNKGEKGSKEGKGKKQEESLVKLEQRVVSHGIRNRRQLPETEKNEGVRESQGGQKKGGQRTNPAFMKKHYECMDEQLQGNEFYDGIVSACQEEAVSKAQGKGAEKKQKQCVTKKIHKGCSALRKGKGGAKDEQEDSDED